MTDTSQRPATDSTPAAPKGGWTVKRTVTVAAGAFGGLILLLFIIGLALAVFTNVEATAPRIQIIRDIFIIIMALEFILIVLALAVLILQVARLINLLQNEIKPILQNTQETVSSAKGTIDFVGSNVTRPIIRAGGFLAGTSVLLRDLGGIRRAMRRNGREQHDDE
ncbi:MAG: hypothetical protein HXY41_12465 [Chloroflexi bacterium]|nr:hypothetical protein [Chloroflexota bacterium]